MSEEITDADIRVFRVLIPDERKISFFASQTRTKDPKTDKLRRPHGIEEYRGENIEGFARKIREKVQELHDSSYPRVTISFTPFQDIDSFMDGTARRCLALFQEEQTDFDEYYFMPVLLEQQVG